MSHHPSFTPSVGMLQEELASKVTLGNVVEILTDGYVPLSLEMTGGNKNILKEKDNIF